MFGQVAKKSLRKLFSNQPNETVISLMFLTTANNNACFSIAKKIVNDYDLWINEFMNNWFSLMKYFVAKSNPSTSMCYINSSLASKWPDQIDINPQKYQRCDRLNTILGSDTGLEKWKSRQTTKSELILLTIGSTKKTNNKYLWWMIKFKQIIWRFQINLQIYNEIHEIRGFTQGFNRKSIDLSTKNFGFQFMSKMKVQFRCN